YARRDEAGLLHFLGRRDGLVKTRGFRVDLGDVEAALLKHEAVLEAAVVAVPHPAYTNLLFGFVVLQEEQGVSEREMRQFLLNRLPPYMCPQAIEVRSELPKTSTGKIARRPLQDELERVQSSEEGANRFV
ncbi:MAG TPA: hypothetical protein VFV52_15155, partial [Bacilli bacterium]|nr:hypothetical protein [Bacilli bacterium]